MSTSRRVIHKFAIDFSKPESDGVFDGAAFEKFLHDRIWVGDGKRGQLGDSVVISRPAKGRLQISTTVPFSKQSLKFLTKKFLKKNQLRDWIRVISTRRDTYELRFFNIAENEGDEDE
ncbi:large subunit ribosomal protein L22e [Cantharellus anzutake]|uniref:large subunit ribosomal protein L22e n=1 Tax=Cantharellus anzutake TaxID=1750568 RepID=UPI00190753B2|nr:large subunit ribosomal protein L22e [Cantharellus anzutake]KAF8337938.1 large subunit ribosomal protein L22e [Cantharellus anzutake]